MSWMFEIEEFCCRTQQTPFAGWSLTAVLTSPWGLEGKNSMESWFSQVWVRYWGILSNIQATTAINLCPFLQDSNDFSNDFSNGVCYVLQQNASTN